MNHRHLEVAPGTPPEAQPLAAIVDILQRGDLDDWRPIARAIRRDPMGEFADKVLRLVDAYPMYGTSSLWRSWIHRCRARAEGSHPSSPGHPGDQVTGSDPGCGLSGNQEDPDAGLELREGLADELEASLSAVSRGGATHSAEQVARRLGLSW